MPLNWETIPESISKLPIQEPLQSQIINEQAQMGRENYNPNKIEEYARQNLFGKTLPRINQAYSNIGPGNLYSSNRLGSLAAAGGELESGLANLRYQHGLNQLKLGLTPQFEYLYKEPQAGLKEEFARKLIGNIADKVPELAGKGAEYVWNYAKGKPQQQGQQTTGGALATGLAGGTAGVATGAAIDKALSPAKEQGTELAAKTAVENQTAQKLANEAGTGTAATTAGVVGGAGLGKAAVTGAAKMTPLMAAAIGWGVPLALAATGFIGIQAWQTYQQFMKDRFGTSIPPLPGNWTELTGPERSDIQTARQIATPFGQVGHEDIEHLEREFDIYANSKVPWEQRWQNVTGKIAEFEKQQGMEPSNFSWIDRYKKAKAKKGGK